MVLLYTLSHLLYVLRRLTMHVERRIHVTFRDEVETFVGLKYLLKASEA